MGWLLPLISNHLSLRLPYPQNTPVVLQLLRALTLAEMSSANNSPDCYRAILLGNDWRIDVPDVDRYLAYRRPSA